MVKRNALLDRDAVIGRVVLNIMFRDERYSAKSQEGNAYMSGINNVC